MEREKRPEGRADTPANDNGPDTGKQIDLHASDSARLISHRFSKASRKPPPANDDVPARR